MAQEEHFRTLVAQHCPNVVWLDGERLDRSGVTEKRLQLVESVLQKLTHSNSRLLERGRRDDAAQVNDGSGDKLRRARQLLERQRKEGLALRDRCQTLEAERGELSERLRSANEMLHGERLRRHSSTAANLIAEHIVTPLANIQSQLAACVVQDSQLINSERK